MSYEFWKFVKIRFTYLNPRLLIILWTTIIANMLGFDDWLESHSYWYKFAFDQWHLFISCYLIILAGFGLYAMKKVYKIEHRRQMDRLDEEHRRFLEQIDRQMNELMRRR